MSDLVKPRPLSELQRAMLRALDRLGAHDVVTGVSARDAGTRTGQTSDGAAYTLRSLVRRELAGRGYGEASTYWLTTEGLAAARQEPPS